MNKVFLSILTKFFVTLGVIFFFVLIAAGYFFVTDPYNLKPLLFGVGETTDSVAPTNAGTVNINEDGNVGEGSVDTEEAAVSSTQSSENNDKFTLSSAQREALIALGVDPAAVPTTISLAQETCFVGVLGASRVGEVKAGAVPTPLEFLRAKSCL